MTNKEKYGNPDDAANAFYTMCSSHRQCITCPLCGVVDGIIHFCFTEWLGLDGNRHERHIKMPFGLTRKVTGVGLNEFPVIVPTDKLHDETEEVSND